MTVDFSSFSIDKKDGQTILKDHSNNRNFRMECFDKEHALDYKNRENELRQASAKYCVVPNYRMILVPLNEYNIAPVDFYIFSREISRNLSKYYFEYDIYSTSPEIEKRLKQRNTNSEINRKTYIWIAVIAVILFTLLIVFFDSILIVIFGIICFLAFAKEVFRI